MPPEFLHGFGMAMVLSGMGLILSYYFYQVHDRGKDPVVWWLPTWVQMTDCRCDEIVNTEFGLKFGYSNAFWGVWYYLVLMMLLIGFYYFQFPLINVIIILVVLAFCYSLYLLWALYIMRVLCRPCIGAHLVNLALFILILSKTYPLLFTH